MAGKEAREYKGRWSAGTDLHVRVICTTRFTLWTAAVAKLMWVTTFWEMVKVNILSGRKSFNLLDRSSGCLYLHHALPLTLPAVVLFAQNGKTRRGHFVTIRLGLAERNCFSGIVSSTRENCSVLWTHIPWQFMEHAYNKLDDSDVGAQTVRNAAIDRADTKLKLS